MPEGCTPCAHTLTGGPRQGERCNQPAVRGYSVCRMHGAHGKDYIYPLKHGAYAKLPPRIRERYEEYVRSPEYVALREQIALNQALQDDLVERLDELDSTQSRQDWLRATDRAIDALRADDPGKALSILEKLRPTLFDAARRDEIENRLLTFGEMQRRLKETEVKRMVAANQVLTITESYNLVTRLVGIIEEYIPDPEIRGRAVRELSGVLERRNAPPPALMARVEEIVQ